MGAARVVDAGGCEESDLHGHEDEDEGTAAMMSSPIDRCRWIAESRTAIPTGNRTAWGHRFAGVTLMSRWVALLFSVALPGQCYILLDGPNSRTSD